MKHGPHLDPRPVTRRPKRHDASARDFSSLRVAASAERSRWSWGWTVGWVDWEEKTEETLRSDINMYKL